MKEISIKIDDEFYRRASQKFEDLEAKINQHVTEYLVSIKGGDEAIPAARSRIAELFGTTHNFAVGVRPTREEMHELRRRSIN